MKKIISLGRTTFLATVCAICSAGAAETLTIPSAAATPEWPKPPAPSLPANAGSVHSKDLELVHSPNALGDFVLRVDGKDFAIGQNRPLIGYLNAGELHWFETASTTDKWAASR